LTELFEKYSAKAIRITTDKPEKFADGLRKLSYVERISVDSRGVSLIAVEGAESKIYEDAPKVAKEIGATIMGIELGTTSLEQLYYKVVKEKEMKR